MLFAGGPQAALNAATPQSAPQLVLLDVRMGNFHGPDLYPQLCERWQQSPQVILVTAEHNIALRRRGKILGLSAQARSTGSPEGADQPDAAEK